MFCKKTIRLCEAVFDIAFEAGELMATGKIETDDSRELFHAVLEWAKEFESSFNDEQDYMLSVLEFADKKLNESYPKKGNEDTYRFGLSDEQQHIIYRAIEREYAFEDIKQRISEMSEDELLGKDPDALSEDERFLAGVLARWDKSKDWCDTIHDVDWELCDLAIEEELKKGGEESV